MEKEIAVDLDSQSLGECLKSISEIGGTTYQNICTGVISYVPWGVLDWVVTVLALTIGFLFVLMFVKMIIT